jgi:hypothetical protein
MNMSGLSIEEMATRLNQEKRSLPGGEKHLSGIPGREAKVTPSLLLYAPSHDPFDIVLLDGGKEKEHGGDRNEDDLSPPPKKRDPFRIL